MEGKGSFLILLSIVALLTLILTLVTVYVFFAAGAPFNSKAVGSQNAIHKESDFKTMDLFEGKKYFNLKNGDSNKIAVIQISVILKYFKEIKGIKTEEKLAAYENEIKETIGTYFQNMTLEEAKLTETKEKTKKELTKRINDLLMANEAVKKDIVYTIIFDEWFYQ